MFLDGRVEEWTKSLFRDDTHVYDVFSVVD